MTAQTAANNGSEKKAEAALDKRVKALDNAIQKAIDEHDKEKILQKDLELVQIIKADPKRVAAIKTLSLRQIHEIMKSIGFKNDISVLADMLDKLDIRKKQKVKWLSGIDNFSKCECGGQIIKIRRIVLEFIGQKKLNYEYGKYCEFINNQKNKNSIFYQVDKIIKNNGLEKCYGCTQCNSFFIIWKIKGKRAFKKSDELKSLFLENINKINNEIYNKLYELGLTGQEKNKGNQENRVNPEVQKSANNAG